MAVNNSDYLLQQLVNQTKDNNDSLSAIRELLAESIKNEKKGSTTKGGSKGSPRSGSSNNTKSNQGGSFGKLFKSLSSEVSNVSKTMLNSSSNVSTVINSLGMSAGSFAGSLTMLGGPIGVAASAFKMVAGAGMAVYNALNAQLEVYNKINSAGVSLAEGYSSVLRGAGNSMMSINEFTETLITHSDVVAQLNGAYGDGTNAMAKLVGSVKNAQNELGLYGVSTKTLTDLTARNIKFQKQYGGVEMLRNMDQAKSSESFILTMTKLSKSIGESVDSLLNKTKSLDKSLDSRALQISLKSYAGLPAETATLTTKAFNEAAASMGDMGSDFLRLISHRLTLGGVPDDLLSPIINEFADLGEILVRSGTTDAEVIKKKQVEFVRANRERIEADIRHQRALGNESAAMYNMQLLDMEAAYNENSKAAGDALSQFTDRFNRWFGESITNPMMEEYANIRNRVGNYLTEMADSTDGFWGFLGALALDGFGLFPVAKDAVAYLDRIGADFTNWLDGLGADIFGSGYDNVSKAFDTFMNDLMDLPNQLWKSVKGWFGASEDKAASEVKSEGNPITSYIEKASSTVGEFIANEYDDLKKWNSARNFKPKPSVKHDLLPLINNGKNTQPLPVERTEHVRPDVVITRKDFDKSAWKPGEPPKPPTPDYNMPAGINSRDINKEQTQQIRDQANADMQELLKKLADINEQSLSAVQQTNNYLRSISENTQGERNS